MANMKYNLKKKQRFLLSLYYTVYLENSAAFTVVGPKFFQIIVNETKIVVIRLFKVRHR